jgi:ABC-type dipeptide/oligopeptide/nickel transport system permease subunit
MIAENRQGLQLEPWMVVVPALLIAAITIAINLVSDGIARSLGTSIEAFEEEASGR